MPQANWRWVLLVWSAFGLGVGGAHALAQGVAPPTLVPEAWRLYAADVKARISLAAGTETVAAERVRQALAASEAGAGPSLVVQVWVDRAGRIVRIRTPTALPAPAQSDLETLLRGQATASTPPAAMRQPIVLRLTLQTPDAVGPPPAVREASVFSPPLASRD